jgi:hypothetical protein
MPDRHRLSVSQGRQLPALPAHVRSGDAELCGPAPSRCRRARPLLCRRRLHRRLLRDRLSPWDVAAGSLLVTEAGGLVGNFTGDADYLYQREVVAGNPKIYAQLVTLLAPYTRMIPPRRGPPGAGDSALAMRRPVTPS